MIQQTTLRDSIQVTGVGIHTGELVSLTLKPALVNTGIIFRRTDLSPAFDIPALSQYVGDTRFSTTLAKEGVKLSMVEHVLSALAGLHIDNAIVEVTGAEVPIMDGSAYPLVKQIEVMGLQTQEAPKQFLKIKEVIEVQDGDKWAKIEPYNGFQVAFEVSFNHPAILDQDKKYRIDLSNREAYINEVSKARTFGFLSDFEYLRSKNLALGGSLENAIVLDETHIMNPEGLRYSNELTRHKILDAIGDLYLLGSSVLGSFSAYKSGHTLNDLLVQKILATPSAWEKVSHIA